MADFRQHAERVIRQIVSHFKGHPAVVGYQIDNETFPTNVPTQYTNAAFLERLKRKFGTPDKMNKAWGLVYWGQLVDRWEDLRSRDSAGPNWPRSVSGSELRVSALRF